MNRAMSSSVIQQIRSHIKCRGGVYPGSNVHRTSVPGEKVAWDVHFPDYAPIYYDASVLAGKPWADPEMTEKLNFNCLDGPVDRRSHNKPYEINKDRYPVNSLGRTGIKGRGLLGRWGPNHAADPIVSRWKRTLAGEIVGDAVSNKAILQICIIRRRDCGEFALPGGMVDAGEQISQTLKREFNEEALNSDNSKASQQILDSFFAATNGHVVYKGYVDDPRNTDNAWMETVAVHYHDDSGEQVGRFNLCAGDDAAHVQWMDINKDIQFYASHRTFIEIVVDRLKAHW